MRKSASLSDQIVYLLQTAAFAKEMFTDFLILRMRGSLAQFMLHEASIVVYQQVSKFVK
jgi:hypothetical protein